MKKSTFWILILIAGLIAIVLFSTAEKKTPSEGIKGSTLNIMVFEGYDDKEVLDKFKQEYEVDVNVTYITTNEEAFAKLKAGGVGKYDLLTLYNGLIGNFKDNDVIEEIDYSKLKYVNQLFPELSKTEWNTFDGKTYSVTLVWATIPLMYNADYIPFIPKAWADLLKPEFKNKIMMFDEGPGNFFIAGFINGYDNVSRINKNQLEKNKDTLRKYIAQSRTLVTSFGEIKDLLASGDVWASMYGWEAVVAWGQEEGANIQYVFPKEGTFAWSDNWCIIKNSPNKEAAYEFIDFFTKAENQAILATHLQCGTPNKEAVRLLDKDTKSLYAYDDLKKQFEKIKFLEPLPTSEEEAEGKYVTYEEIVAAWEELKAEYF